MLRLGAVLTMLAFPTMLLPVEWMAATHRWLGLGEFPRAPIVDYLARSIAGLYGFHGVLLLIVSRDPVRHGEIVRFVGVMNILFGVMMFGVAVHAGMPAYWTYAEGPFILLAGVVVILLHRRVSAPRGAGREGAGR